MSACVEINGLYKTYYRHKWLLGAGTAHPVLQGVNLTLKQGQVLGLVGESGCGKSTLCKVLLAIEKPTSGTVHVEGKDITQASKAELKKLRRVMQVVYQDPYSSLDPRMTVRQLLSEPLDIHGLYPEKAGREKFLQELLSSVGLARTFLDRYPHEFSGGQRQRICIARALALDPKILIADEPVSALDVSVQAQILNLLCEIRRKRNLTLLFVTHDFAVARFLCDEIAVMYKGRIVELAKAQELFIHPKHPYTQALLSAVPVVGRPLKALPAASTLAKATGKGCDFASRCPHATDTCQVQVPALQPLTSAHQCACIQFAKGE